jgi:hypothetical protein
MRGRGRARSSFERYTGDETKRKETNLVPNQRKKSCQKAMAIVLSCFLLVSCSTYYLTPENLRTQISEAVPAEGTFIFTTGGLFLFKKMMNNGIRTLVVTDKDGKEKRLNVTQRTQIRIHKKDGDYSTFYFDTLYFHNNTVVGQRTHFFPSEIKPIPFEDITKIEIQK